MRPAIPMRQRFHAIRLSTVARRGVMFSIDHLLSGMRNRVAERLKGRIVRNRPCDNLGECQPPWRVGWIGRPLASRILIALCQRLGTRAKVGLPTVAHA